MDFPVKGAKGLDGDGDRVATPPAGEFSESADVALRLFEAGHGGVIF